MSEDKDPDYYYIDGIKCWKKFRAPQERAYAEAIRRAYPDWKLVAGPYCPGKAGCLTYKIEKDGKYKMVHARDGDYAISEDEERWGCTV